MNGKISVLPLNERISRLETSVDSLHEDLTDLRETTKSIGTRLETRSRTDWTMVFTGLMVLLAVYGAAIYPVQNSIVKLDGQYDKVERVLMDNETIISNLRIAQANLAIQSNQNTKSIVTMQEKGTTESNMRLSVVENNFKNIAEDFKEIKEKGSPITDKRLALLERQFEELKILLHEVEKTATK